MWKNIEESPQHEGRQPGGGELPAEGQHHPEGHQADLSGHYLGQRVAPGAAEKAET